MIATAIVHLIDLSGFIGEMEQLLTKWLNVKAHIPKPFSCSYCMTHHIGLLYLLFTGNVTLTNYLILLTLAYLTPVIGSVMMLMKDLMVKAIDAVYDLFKL